MAVKSVSDFQIRSFKNGSADVPSGGGWNSVSTNAHYVAGYGYSSSYNYVTELKFTLTSSAEIFKFQFKNRDYISTAREVKYVILSAEDSSYNNATYTKTCDGIFRAKKGTWETTTFFFQKKLSAGTYYMYLWTARSTSENSFWDIYNDGNGRLELSYGLASDFGTCLSSMSMRDGGVHNEWNEIDVGGNIQQVAGYGWSGSNWVTVFRFILPKRAKSITLSGHYDTFESTKTPELRYKIISGQEDSSFNNPSSSTAADGVYTMPAGDNTYVNFNMTINKLIPAGLTYLYLWTNKTTSTNNYANLEVRKSNVSYPTTISYVEGGAVIYIDNGSSFDAYEIWIDNGTSWDQYEAYIDNGSSWDVCG